jgi:hypothetical protein
MKKICLNKPQKKRLYQWYKNGIRSYELYRDHQVAKQATSDLGFTVTYSHVSNLRKKIAEEDLSSCQKKDDNQPNSKVDRKQFNIGDVIRVVPCGIDEDGNVFSRIEHADCIEQMPKRKNHLSVKQKMDLHKYFEKNIQLFCDMKTDEVVEKVSEAMGFAVTVNNLYGLFPSWRSRYQKKQYNKEDLNKRMSIVEATIGSIQKIKNY